MAAPKSGDRAGVADRLGVRTRRRCAPRADAAIAARSRRHACSCWSISATARTGSADPRSRRSTDSSATIAPDLDDRSGAGRILRRRASACMHKGKLLAYHDRSDGGLFVTLVEMAFASRCGLTIDLDELAGMRPRALFTEELGAVCRSPRSIARRGRDVRSRGCALHRRGPSRARRADSHFARRRPPARRRAGRPAPRMVGARRMRCSVCATIPRRPIRSTSACSTLTIPASRRI